MLTWSEDAIRMVNELSLFSSNEDLDEVATNELRWSPLLIFTFVLFFNQRGNLEISNFFHGGWVTLKVRKSEMSDFLIFRGSSPLPFCEKLEISDFSGFWLSNVLGFWFSEFLRYPFPCAKYCKVGHFIFSLVSNSARFLTFQFSRFLTLCFSTCLTLQFFRFLKVLFSLSSGKFFHWHGTFLSNRFLKPYFIRGSWQSPSPSPPRGLIRGSMTLARYFLVFRELEMGCSLCAEVEATEATKLGQNILNFAGAPPPHFCSATSNFKGHQISWSTFFGKNCFCSFLQIHAASSFSRLCFIEKYAVRENRWCEESTGSVNGVTFKSFFQNHLWFDHFCHLCFDNKELSWAWGSDLFVHEWFSLWVIFEHWKTSVSGKCHPIKLHAIIFLHTPVSRNRRVLCNGDRFRGVVGPPSPSPWFWTWGTPPPSFGLRQFLASGTPLW